MGTVLIADASAMTRHMLARAVAGPYDAAIEVDCGWKVLWHLAEAPCSLVVIGSSLADVRGQQLLAMVRTAGLSVPFILIIPFCGDGVRASTARVGYAEILDEATDAVALRAARDRLRGAAPVPARPRSGTTRALARVARRIALSRVPPVMTG